MESKRSFAHTAARLSLWLGIGAAALFAVAFVGRLLPIYMPAQWSATLFSLFGAVLFVVLVLSVVCGFIALSGVKQHGRDGILLPAAIGMSLSALMLVPMLHGLGQALGNRLRAAAARNGCPRDVVRPETVPGGVTWAGGPASPRATHFIAAPDCADMAHDPSSDVLYISSGSQLIRFSLRSNALMSPLEFGGSLAGMDISPDGRTLAIADRTHAGEQAWIHLYNIPAGTNARVLFKATRMEGGTYSVAFGSDAAVYFTSTFEGSGWVPFRKYNPVTRAVSEIRTMSQNSMLCASADRHVIAFAEGNNSAGDYGAFDVRTGKNRFASRANAFLWEIAANRDGSQFAIPTYKDTIIHSAEPRTIGGSSTEGRPIAAVFHPTRDLAYFSWMNSTTIRAFETKTWRELERLDVGVPFENTGNHGFQQGRLKMSGDGSWLFCTVKEGVFYLRPNVKSDAVAERR